ncbi:MAG: cellobiose phosphorylase [Lachnospiraceae bacterium]|nr:cellobiose phosphorylase [Lachnospiraceae bacterium]
MIRFNEDNSAFTFEGADKVTGLYYPLASEAGLKSCVTPTLAGDSKLNQNTFLYEPASIEDLTEKRYSRNFWVLREGKTPWSATGASVWQMASDKESTTVTAGLMWHKTERTSEDDELSASVLSFIPVDKLHEIHVVTVKNISKDPVKIRFCAALPIYGRSADNLRDHRHVTSLLNRIYVTKRGVSVAPTLSFDERGHKVNHMLYFAEAITCAGEAPEEFFAEVKDFAGEGGNLERPMALANRLKGVKPGYKTAGGETMSASLFAEKELAPEEETVYITIAGITSDVTPEEPQSLEYKDLYDILKTFENTRDYWDKKSVLKVETGDKTFDGFMRFVSFQPELRRIFGCSFLPHHDYGRGGKGFRDLWQDCLALVLFNPKLTSDLLYNNFKGLRVDGTNATIIGDKPGEFKADRNGIPRVWMDHGFWPLLTTKLYIDETGDLDFLLKKTGYYKDSLVKRGTDRDDKWDGENLHQQTEEHKTYEGSIIEHLLLETLTEFWEVGAHNMIKLRGADWNDALDMAPDKGESVAFTHAYAGNLVTLSNLLMKLHETGVTSIKLLKEIEPLLSDNDDVYASLNHKKCILNGYLDSVVHSVSGKRKTYKTKYLAENMKSKAEFLFALLRNQEWIGDDGYGRYNGYYDNQGQALERGNGTQMTLTGQVFAIMSGVATDEQIKEITGSADKLLYDEYCGGYRLNTDFGKGLSDMGRAFFFAYGEKENGAVFSHMAVMYANALYSRGYAREGYKALKALYKQSMDFETSRIYPGIPEYFGKGGRGLYQFLTGAASWYVLTAVTQMYGICGEYGALTAEPKLMAEQFNEKGKALITLPFDGKTLHVEYVNEKHLEYGSYRIASAVLNGKTELEIENGKKAVLKDTSLLTADNHLKIVLEQGE